jgi:hypothetical protein
LTVEIKREDKMLDNIMVQDYIDYIVEYDEDYEKDDIAYEDKVSERMSAE